MATAEKTAASRTPPATLSSSARSMDSVHFSSGNPRIEETRGVVLLHPDPPAVPSSSDLPAGRKPQVCVLAVPNHMTYADFCRFCGAFVPHTLEMRIVRIDGTEDQYSVLIKFDTQRSTDSFYKHFNGKQFSSLEVDVCNVRFVEDVHYTQLIEHAHSSVTSSAEQPTCPVCLERLDQDPGGILTTICNHSFHCSCISKWTDSSCPVRDKMILFGHTRRDRVRNDDIRERLGVTPVDEKLVQHRLRWYGYIQRRPQEAPVRSGIIRCPDNVKRGRGRPNLTWEESVKRDKGL